jgi:hypothetical protein
MRLRETFHNPILGIDILAAFGIFNSTRAAKLSLSKGGGG